jgi:hypothetical protein
MAANIEFAFIAATLFHPVAEKRGQPGVRLSPLITRRLGEKGLYAFYVYRSNGITPFVEKPASAPGLLCDSSAGEILCNSEEIKELCKRRKAH